jgi:hypothetical protein
MHYSIFTIHYSLIVNTDTALAVDSTNSPMEKEQADDSTQAGNESNSTPPDTTRVTREEWLGESQHNCDDNRDCSTNAYRENRGFIIGHVHRLDSTV